MSIRLKFFLIFVLAVVSAILAYPREDKILRLVGIKNGTLQIKQGLDLQGGAQLTYEADLSKVGTNSEEKTRALDSLVKVIENRVNAGGTSEATVRTTGANRVTIELPGVRDVNDAISVIGKTADLRFLEATATAATPDQFTDTGISGKDIDRADVDFDTQRNEPIVRLRLKSGDATKRFGDVTTRINKDGTRLVTMLDQDIVFGPATVSTPITDGTAQLQGNFTVQDAKKIAQLINAGALPVPVSLVEQRTVGPTLGQESVARSLVAGLIGLSVVALFMILYYRLAGVMAVLALIVYTLITLAWYKLSFVFGASGGFFIFQHIVLTLAGIAGFILSIGMAVDANILIFERMKEELRAGKSFVAAVEAGFDRAWTSIRDSNMSTLITSAILYIFGATIIKGFAVTLALGVLISLFTSVVISRTLLRLLISTKVGRNPRFYGLSKKELSQ